MRLKLTPECQSLVCLVVVSLTACSTWVTSLQSSHKESATWQQFCNYALPTTTAITFHLPLWPTCHYGPPAAMPYLPLLPALPEECTECEVIELRWYLGTQLSGCVWVHAHSLYHHHQQVLQGCHLRRLATDTDSGASFGKACLLTLETEHLCKARHTTVQS